MLIILFFSGDPYEVDIRYGGEPIHGAPFKMTSNPDMNYSPDGGDLDRQGRPSISGRKDSDLLGKLELLIKEQMHHVVTGELCTLRKRKLKAGSLPGI